MPDKGVHLYVEVIKLIASKYPDWSFGLIGSYKLGENNITDYYAQNVISKFKEIGNQAKFFGFKDQNFVQKKMKTASIIIIPSLWQEPFGLVASEAMSNGISIIASKVGGIPEIVKRNGILIKNINKQKLKNELEKLMGNSDKIKMLQKLSWNNFEHSSKKSSKNLDNYRKRILYSHFVNN